MSSDDILKHRMASMGQRGGGMFGLDPVQQDRLDELNRKKREQYREFRLRRFLNIKPERREEMLAEILDNIMRNSPNYDEYSIDEEDELQSLESRSGSIRHEHESISMPPPYPYLWDFTYEELEKAHAEALFDDDIKG